ncbi:hypothetical protein [Paenibacillus thermotolerans]|uniref:hypothetical protein n=1 Tax=Paenibacillus thermotolerans TaxID=3027807 RepID=UPI002368735B|nr:MULTISPECIES: hypothetical protein [unclassified Paenibacillus]
MSVLKRIGCIFTLFAFLAGSAAAEESELAATKAEINESLLQQGLMIHEIDKEVERLKTEEKEVERKIGESEASLVNQQARLDRKREEAGRVLRAYYMGHRDHMWLLLINMKSINEALVVLDYMNAVVRNDFRVLFAYRAEYEERQRLLAELELRQQSLQTVIADRLKQKDRLTALQEELERELAKLTEEERAFQEEQIERLTDNWETEGIPLFEMYLTEFSKAMNDITELLSDEKRISLNGTELTVTLTDDDFNAFLRKKNPLFDSFEFRFQPDKLLVTGSYASKEAIIEGRYILEKEPENLLRFELISLAYNGFQLPETTAGALQRQYDLSFRPGQLFAGLEASELETKEGTLEVKLTLQGFPFSLGF